MSGDTAGDAIRVLYSIVTETSGVQTQRTRYLHRIGHWNVEWLFECVGGVGAVLAFAVVRHMLHVCIFCSALSLVL